MPLRLPYRISSVYCDNYGNKSLVTTNTDPLNLPAIRESDFPAPFPDWRPGPIVISAHLGKPKKRQPGVSVIQAWRLGSERYVLLEQFRGSAESEELEDILNEYIELFRPASVLAGNTSGNRALIAKIVHLHPHLVHATEPDRSCEAASLRALAEAIVGKRISIPTDAPCRDVCVRQLCALPASSSKALVRAAMQVVAYAHYFTMPAPTERRAMAAGVVGLHAVSVDRRWGEKPGLCSNGREITKRSLTGPVFNITTEVIY